MDFGQLSRAVSFAKTPADQLRCCKHCNGDDFGEGQGNFIPSVQVPSDSNPMEMLGLPRRWGYWR